MDFRVIFRLYWYPCKLLYATLYGGVYLGPQDGKFMPLLGVMLILIYGMNVYWFNVSKKSQINDFWFQFEVYHPHGLASRIYW